MEEGEPFSATNSKSEEGNDDQIKLGGMDIDEEKKQNHGRKGTFSVWVEKQEVSGPRN